MKNENMRISNLKIQGKQLLGLDFVFLGSTIASPKIINSCFQNPNPFLLYGSIAIGSMLTLVCTTTFICNRYHLKKEKDKQNTKKQGRS